MLAFGKAYVPQATHRLPNSVGGSSVVNQPGTAATAVRDTAVTVPPSRKV
jgi:hypothetical protein